MKTDTEAHNHSSVQKKFTRAALVGYERFHATKWILEMKPVSVVL